MIARSTTALILVALTACSTQPENIHLATDLNKIHQLPSVSSNKFNMNVALADSNGVILSGSKSSKIGVTTKFSKLRNYRYPKSYSLPEKINNSNGVEVFPVTPSAPLKFDSIEKGWSISLKPQLAGGVVTLEGEITHVSTKVRQGVFGEGADPIFAVVPSIFGKTYVTITENRGDIPLISKDVYPVFIRAIPNKTYKINISDGVTFTLTLNEK